MRMPKAAGRKDGPLLPVDVLARTARRRDTAVRLRPWSSAVVVKPKRRGRGSQHCRSRPSCSPTSNPRAAASSPRHMGPSVAVPRTHSAKANPARLGPAGLSIAGLQAP